MSWTTIGLYHGVTDPVSGVTCPRSHSQLDLQSSEPILNRVWDCAILSGREFSLLLTGGAVMVSTSQSCCEGGSIIQLQVLLIEHLCLPDNLHYHLPVKH